MDDSFVSPAVFISDYSQSRCIQHIPGPPPGARSVNQRSSKLVLGATENLNAPMRRAGADPGPPNVSWPEPGWDVLEIITSSSADGITIQDATGKLIYANDSAARMFGFISGQDMQRASIEEIMERFELLDVA